LFHKRVEAIEQHLVVSGAVFELRQRICGRFQRRQLVRRMGLANPVIRSRQVLQSILRLLRQVASSSTRRSRSGRCSSGGSMAGGAGSPSAASPASCGYSSRGVRPPACRAASSSAGAKLSPASSRLDGSDKCSRRALFLALRTSSGCCRISSSTWLSSGVAKLQIQAVCARRQAAHIERREEEVVMGGDCTAAHLPQT
jgi:hypothetical protein